LLSVVAGKDEDGVWCGVVGYAENGGLDRAEVLVWSD